MEPLDKLDLETLFAEGAELPDRDTLKQYILQGVNAYKSVTALTTKNQQILGEKKAAAEAAAKYEQALQAKGLTLEDIDTWNPNPAADETLAKFQKQLEDTRKQFDAERQNWKVEQDAVVAERDRLSQTITGTKIQQEFIKAATAAGVAAGSIEDLFLVLKGRDVAMVVNDSGEVKAKRPSDVLESDLSGLLGMLKADPSYQKYYTGKFVSGSGNSPDGKSTSMPNPWEPGKENLSEQTRIYRESPALAEQMRKMAGV
jgi:hypothetical protein